MNPKKEEGREEVTAFNTNAVIIFYSLFLFDFFSNL